MRRLGIAVVATGAALATSIAASAQDRADFTERDNGREVRLFSPQFSVELPRNAGTGYQWEFGNGVSRNVVLLSRTVSTPPHAPGIVGFGQMDRFVLRATAEGGELRIGLLPPGSGAPARVWRVTFHSAYAERSDSHGYLAPSPAAR